MRTLIAVLVAAAALAAASASGGHYSTVSVNDVTWKDPRVRNLYRLARCETGYLKGGRPNPRHHNGTYSGMLGFAHSTWEQFRHHVRPVPRATRAADATMRQQYAVGLVLVERFHGYSSWPACHRRHGIYTPWERP